MAVFTHTSSQSAYLEAAIDTPKNSSSKAVIDIRGSRPISAGGDRQLWEAIIQSHFRQGRRSNIENIIINVNAVCCSETAPHESNRIRDNNPNPGKSISP